MTEPSLLIICITALFAVILLLALLAGVIRGLMALFPEKGEGPDAALLAAINSAAAFAFPDAKVTRIEEIR